MSAAERGVTSNQFPISFRDQLRQIRDLANDLIMQLDALERPDVFIVDGPQPHPDFPSVCMTCGGSLVEKDGLWVHAKGPKRGLRGKRVDRHEDVSA